MAKKISTSVQFAPDVREGIRQVEAELGITMHRQIGEAWAEQYKFVYAPLIRAKQTQAKRGKRGFAHEVVS